MISASRRCLLCSSRLSFEQRRLSCCWQALRYKIRDAMKVPLDLQTMEASQWRVTGGGRGNKRRRRIGHGHTAGRGGWRVSWAYADLLVGRFPDSVWAAVDRELLEAGEEVVYPRHCLPLLRCRCQQRVRSQARQQRPGGLRARHACAAASRVEEAPPRGRRGRT